MKMKNVDIWRLAEEISVVDSAGLVAPLLERGARSPEHRPGGSRLALTAYLRAIADYVGRTLSVSRRRASTPIGVRTAAQHCRSAPRQLVAHSILIQFLMGQIVLSAPDRGAGIREALVQAPERYGRTRT